MSLLQINEKLDFLFNDLSFSQELQKSLLFALEISEVSFAHISILDSSKQFIKNNSGVDFDMFSEYISQWNSIVIENKEPYFISEDIINSKQIEIPLQFYAGFPLIYDDKVIGIFCLADFKNKILSDSQLKVLNYVLGQIQSSLESQIRVYQKEKNLNYLLKIQRRFFTS
ncbi:GAF domain-containing protein [Flavobacterium nitratireducens]|uniref:GAF domain-containing protein n=1 Tax=Flavobacterium nitratireducens TaxID=992289 RepID=UPI0024150587|nr:GAF domain-containing protein [Flavobacterium nitratireducens]